MDEIDLLEGSCEGIGFEDLMENREKQRAWLRSLEVIRQSMNSIHNLIIEDSEEKSFPYLLNNLKYY